MRPPKWHSTAIVSAVAFSAFSAVHLIDDFLFDVPLEFHLSVQITLILAFVFMGALVGLVAAAAGGSRAGYLGLSIAGVLIALAQLLKSVPEMLRAGPWHGGLPSEAAAVGLGISAAASAITSFLAWRDTSLRSVEPE